MIDFDWNEKEQDIAKKMAWVWLNQFRIITNGYSLNRNKSYLRRKRCPLLWYTFSVEVNGNLVLVILMMIIHLIWGIFEIVQ